MPFSDKRKPVKPGTLSNEIHALCKEAFGKSLWHLSIPTQRNILAISSVKNGAFFLHAWGELTRNEKLALVKLLAKHGSKRWSTALLAYNEWLDGRGGAASLNSLKKYVGLLAPYMDTKIGKPLYRGMIVRPTSDLGKLEIGKTFFLKSSKPAASYSSKKKVADRFAGSAAEPDYHYGSKGKIGVVVQLVSASGAEVLLCDPDSMDPLLDKLLGWRLSRRNEMEWLLAGKKLKVKLIAKFDEDGKPIKG